ncbi:MAG: TVP38/TMEM64 family protein [Fusicatenibacter sp.]
MNKKEVKTRSAWKICKVVIPVLILLAVIIYFLVNPDISVQTVLSYTPENPILAAIVLLLLYAVKSVTVVFPLIVLEITAGHLFPTGIALLVNLAGLTILMTIPYEAGRFSGMDTVNSLIQKYPKLGSILGLQQRNSFFLSFLLRVIGCLPGDIVTMYLGATETPYYQNLIGGVLGLLPRMILATILGSSIQDPASPMFWISAALTVILMAVSVGGYYIYRHKVQNNQLESNQEDF